MAETIRIKYTYTFGDGTSRSFPLALDATTLAFIPQAKVEPPLWTLLSINKCSNCPLDEQRHTYCPVALNLSGIVQQFKDFISHERVAVQVAVEERAYAKETTMQQGLSPLLGIIMTTSGCPVMEPLKPMVRFHLPFASLTETIFRMVSMYLVAQYFRQQSGMPAELGIEGLKKIYGQVNLVNRDFAKRLRAAAEKDANVNALVILDCFAAMLPLAAEETLEQVRDSFAAYLGPA
ncbi:MAG: hypothetical protein A2X56_03925 [Nitrospirae bacterium GWC2_57_13]|jgi:hypothetical protein|nr:MAG: hypothetical protein A2072_00020 [Nitrospirae bacterium GWC1_57_7]OGW27382.1 MAG: hypothetical protein A2X56_03925 [Nitrospirae bacterium GWC2_57_13]OGW43797.1 MAG: hypothetical protein A2X57_00435 [Nitrospirae bacterium GWD2_57_8]HAR45878.1 hypothetical protein [Nitrospiraceae bacterium]HAS54309.1 hypothetical protein [Nitrospiraceae bacterium]